MTPQTVDDLKLGYAEGLAQGFIDGLRAGQREGEKMGIERAAEWLLRDTQTDNRKEAADAIRALAQGGEK